MRFCFGAESCGKAGAMTARFNATTLKLVFELRLVGIDKDILPWVLCLVLFAIPLAVLLNFEKFVQRGSKLWCQRDRFSVQIDCADAEALSASDFVPKVK